MIDYRITFTPDNGRLQMRVFWAGNVLKYNLHYDINPDKWDKKAYCCADNSTHGKLRIPAREINERIRQYRRAVEGVAEKYLRTYVPSRQEFKQDIDVMLGRKTESLSSDTLQSVISRFVVEQSSLEQWAENTTRKYHTLRDSLKEWNADITLTQFDGKKMTEYYTFLCGQGKKNTTLGKYVSNLKSVLRWASRKGGYKVSSSCLDFSPRIKTIDKTIVWLTWDELLKLYNADLSEMEKDKGPDSCVSEVRDIFCFSCFTGLRFSDIANLKHSDIIGDQIRVPIRKTGETVYIELNKHSRALLERNRDYDVVAALPQIANATCNEKIKLICKFVGIDAPTAIAYYKGSERCEESAPKYSYITMHTGRRTFICNALEKGISPQVVMKWTGHSDYKAMKPYIDISDSAKKSAMRLFDD